MNNSVKLVKILRACTIQAPYLNHPTKSCATPPHLVPPHHIRLNLSGKYVHRVRPRHVFFANLSTDHINYKIARHILQKCNGGVHPPDALFELLVRAGRGGLFLEENFREVGAELSPENFANRASCYPSGKISLLQQV